MQREKEKKRKKTVLYWSCQIPDSTGSSVGCFSTVKKKTQWVFCVALGIAYHPEVSVSLFRNAKEKGILFRVFKVKACPCSLCFLDCSSLSDGTNWNKCAFFWSFGGLWYQSLHETVKRYLRGIYIVVMHFDIVNTFKTLTTGLLLK